MNKLVVLSGVPGSGKSYFSKTIKKMRDSHVYVISSDELRAIIGGSQTNFDNEELMWSMFYDLAKVYSKDPEGIVILDATHISVRHRVDDNLEIAKLFNEVDLVMWNSDHRLVSNQNLQREHPIPPEALEMFFKAFELPTKLDEAFFDKIVVIENNDMSPAIEAVLGKKDISDIRL